MRDAASLSIAGIEHSPSCGMTLLFVKHGALINLNVNSMIFVSDLLAERPQSASRADTMVGGRSGAA